MDLRFNADEKNAYVVTVLNNTVSQYRINPATGALSRRPASTAGTVRSPELIVLAADGKNAYVTGDIGGLSQYAISPATGKITPLSPATLTTAPGGSIGLAVTPAADLAAKASAPAWHGHALTYTIKITDRGPSEAWQVALSDHLPSDGVGRNTAETGRVATAFALDGPGVRPEQQLLSVTTNVSSAGKWHRDRFLSPPGWHHRGDPAAGAAAGPGPACKQRMTRARLYVLMKNGAEHHPASITDTRCFHSPL